MDDDTGRTTTGNKLDPDLELASLRSSVEARSRRREGWIRERLEAEAVLIGALSGAVGQRVRVSVRGAGEIHQHLAAVNAEVLEFATSTRVTWVNAAEVLWVETAGPVPGGASPSPGSWVGLLGDLEEGRLVRFAFTDGSTIDGEILGVGATVSVLGHKGERRHAAPESIAWVSQHL
jgi:hypothetical protein